MTISITEKKDRQQKQCFKKKIEEKIRQESKDKRKQWLQFLSLHSFSPPTMFGLSHSIPAVPSPPPHPSLPIFPHIPLAYSSFHSFCSLLLIFLYCSPSCHLLHLTLLPFASYNLPSKPHYATATSPSLYSIFTSSHSTLSLHHSRCLIFFLPHTVSF